MDVDRIDRMLHDLGRSLQDMGRPLRPLEGSGEGAPPEDEDVAFVRENIARILRGIGKMAAD